MASLTSCRTLAGSKAFTGLRPRQTPRVANGVKVFMKRKDSYMVEVNVGEDEPEDLAVRKFMKKVMDSRVIEQLRARRYKETPLEEFKRRTRERIEKIKSGFQEPTWELEYGQDVDVKPFQDFFPSEDNFDVNSPYTDTLWGYPNEYLEQQGGYLQDSGANAQWGSYVGSYTDAGNTNRAPGTGYGY